MSIKHPSLSPKHGLLLLLILFTVGLIYVYRLGDKALDLDERFSMNIATGSGGPTDDYTQFGRFVANPMSGVTFSSAQYKDRYKLSNVVSTAMNDNGQGLPYFFLLHGWLKLLGTTVLHARLLSSLLMLIAIFLLHGAMLRCGIAPVPALIAVSLFGCNGVVIGLAQYVRFYSLGILLTVVSFHIVLSMRRKPVSNFAASTLGLVWGLMLLNQFFTTLIIAAQCIYLINPAWNKNLRTIVLPIAIGLLSPIAIWVFPLHGWQSLRNIYILQSHEHQAIYSLSAIASPFNLFLGSLSSFAGAVGQPVGMRSGVYSTALQILAALPALLLIFIVSIHRQIPKPSWIQLCLYSITIYLVASVGHSLISGYTLLFQGRYWVFGYVFSYSLLAWALMQGFFSSGSVKWLASCALLITCCRAFYASASAVSGLSMTPNGKLASVYVQPNEDYEGLAGALIKGAGPTDTISYQNWKLAQSVNWFLLDHPNLVQHVDTTQSFAIMIRNGQLKHEVPINRGRTIHARPVWIK